MKRWNGGSNGTKKEWREKEEEGSEFEKCERK
jgi:hypothetical protein